MLKNEGMFYATAKERKNMDLEIILCFIKISDE
jgi:hypothetical protein